MLTGPNGAGKTNLLEAVSYLSPGRGLRGARLADVAHVAGPDAGPAEAWSVAGTLSADGGETALGSGWRAPAEAGEAERRVVRIDGATASGPAALAEHVAMVWLTPSMDRLFSGPPAERRRFLDRLVFAIDTGHAARVQRYDRARRHRARLLRAGTNDDAWLGALERSMAENAVAIGAARLDLAMRLEQFLPANSAPFPRIALAADGLVERALAGTHLRSRWRSSSGSISPPPAGRRPKAARSTGPQRSDLIVTDRDRGMAAEQCSTGEQKAMLIALVTAHAVWWSASAVVRRCCCWTRSPPTWTRAAGARCSRLSLDVGAQAWLTGTEPGVFRPLGTHAQFFTVRPGTVEGE